MTDRSARRIDSHHHVWDLTVRAQPWTRERPALQRSFSIDDLRPCLQRNRIDSTVVVQTAPDVAETRELLALASEEPVIGGVVGWVDLTHPRVADELAALRAGPGGAALVGVRHQVHDEADPQWLNHADVRAGLRAIGAAGLAFDLLVRPPQMAAAAQTVRALAEVRFVLDHAGKPPIGSPDLIEQWRRGLRSLAASDNCAVKLSGLLTLVPGAGAPAVVLPFADEVLEVFGPGRTMFGSDWPVCLLAGGYDEAVSLARDTAARLSPGERDAVFGGCATAWYRLRDAG